MGDIDGYLLLVRPKEIKTISCEPRVPIFPHLQLRPPYYNSYHHSRFPYANPLKRILTKRHEFWTIYAYHGG
jgi:hypothetical protein